MIQDRYLHIQPHPDPQCQGKILLKLIEYYTKHADPTVFKSHDMAIWDEEFVKIVDLDTVYDLMLAANFLDVKELLDFTCLIYQKFAQKIYDCVRFFLNRIKLNN